MLISLVKQTMYKSRIVVANPMIESTTNGGFFMEMATDIEKSRHKIGAPGCSAWRLQSPGPPLLHPELTKFGLKTWLLSL